MIQRVEGILKSMEAFSSTKKNMSFPIRRGIDEVFHEHSHLRNSVEYGDRDLRNFEQQLRDRIVQKIKGMKSQWVVESVDEGCQLAPQPTARSTPALRKRPIRAETHELGDNKKLEDKRLRASTKKRERGEIPARKNLRKLKPMKTRK